MDQPEHAKKGCSMNAIKKIIRIIGYFVEAVEYIILYPIAKMVYGHRHIHIFAERGTDARDNGYHLYRYYREKHPEVEVYYIITKNSADRPKVAELGNVVNRGSLKHHLLFIAAEYKISTHIMGYSPNIDFYIRFADRMRVKGYRIFLQHGVIPYDLPALYRDKTNLDIFVCGAKPEFDFISNGFGYQNGEVKYTGLARYDALHNVELKKQILCMPTWRKYLKYDANIHIEQSEYVKKWNGLINHPELISALRNHGLKLIFYPHYEMQEHISAFQSCCDEVVIADFKNYDVQQLLKESQLLITDYSSVFFDFAYMGKPVIYYQFDKQRFFAEHYAKGYFDYETMGFGEVVEQENTAIEVILEHIAHQFAMGSEYQRRIDGFFPLHDQDNCKRIFDEIEKL